MRAEEQLPTDFIYARVVQNPAFDATDEVQLRWLLFGYAYWSADLRDLLQRQQHLESCAIYIASKYSSLRERSDDTYHQVKARHAKSHRDGGLKGEGLQNALWTEPAIIAAREVLLNLKELESLFDKLYWSVVKKNERINRHFDLDRRVGS